MLDVVDGLVEERCDVVVEESVDDVAAGAVAGHQPQGAQQAQLVGHRGLLHPDRGGQLGHGAGGLAQPGEDQQPIRRRESLQGFGHLDRGRRIQ